MSKDIKTLKKTTAMVDLVHRAAGSIVAPREVLKRIEVLSPQAVQTLEDLMLRSRADSVRLRAAIEILALAGISKETRISVKTDTTGMTASEIDARLQTLLGRAETTVLEGTFEDVTENETEEDED